jgi:hypothetical protein
MIRHGYFAPRLLAASAVALSVWAAASCSSGTSGTQQAPGGTGASSGTSATSGSGGSGVSSGGGGTTSGTTTSGVASGGATSGAGNTSGTIVSGTGTASGGAGTTTSSGSGSTSGSTGATSGSGSTGTSAAGGNDAGPVDDGAAAMGGDGGTPATCAKATPSPNAARASECDYLLQSLDFEEAYGYTAPAIKTTALGSAFGQWAINNCSPYCYSKNLTVGIDIDGSNPTSLKGEIIVELPATGAALPIAVADMTRNALAWITFDGAAKPTFEIDTQFVVETTTGVVAAVETKPFFKANGNLQPFGPFNVTNNYSYGNGCEFKYFPFTSNTGFPTGLMNVTGMGFRIVAQATAGQSWHGVAYIDHLQIRAPTPDNPPGTYPFGLF